VATGTTYYYVVTAVDGSGHESVFSNEASAVVPAAPTGLTATPGSPGSVTLAWTASTSNVAGYNVYRSTASGAYTSTNKIASVAAPGFMDSGLTSGTTYYYVVTAVDASGNESPFSTEASVVAH
jgi:fibronectin type 3 domain-containing protein